MEVELTGIAWYRREDYDHLKAAFKDGWSLPDTFDSRLEKAELAYDTLTSEGLKVVKALIDPDTFPVWCRDHGFEMDTAARMAFGQECAANELKAKQGLSKRARASALRRRFRRRSPQGTE